MNKEELSAKLSEKMSEELENFRDWLLKQTPEEILAHTYEYTTKLDIVLLMDETALAELESAQLNVLLESPAPLEDIYKDFRDIDLDYQDTLKTCIADFADSLIQAKQENQRKPSVLERLSAKPVPGDKPAVKVAKAASHEER